MYLEVGNEFASLTHNNFIIIFTVTFIYSFVIMREDLILFASRGTNVPLFYNGGKNKTPNHNFSIIMLLEKKFSIS